MIQFSKKIKAGNQFIGENLPCFIVAEIGINHNGDINLAKKSIEAAKQSGANAVKFQNYNVEDFIHDKALTITYTSNGHSVTEPQFDLFTRCELKPDQLRELKKYCDHHNILFLSTPTSKNGIDILVEIDTPLIKNGSDFITQLELIKEMAMTGKPVILSTGMATKNEIDDAVNVFASCNNNQDLILLHCTSNYPTSMIEVNLNKIPLLADTYGCLSGFSDHSLGNTAAIGARVLGACFIEKHFTLDKNLPGPDHHFSCDPDELLQLVDSIRNIESALGEKSLGLNYEEMTSRREFRLSCIATCDLEPGTTILDEHITFGRPGTGVPPKYKNSILNTVLKRKIKKGGLFTMDDQDE